ncbi:MAG: hypothetical protein ACOZCL_10140 [Bacillota bacterium]
MRRLMTVFLTAVLLFITLSGCSSSARGNESEGNIEGSGQQQLTADKIVENFDKLVADSKKPYELLDFINTNIANLDKEQAANVVGKYIQVVEEAEYTYNEDFYSGDKQITMLKYFNSGFVVDEVENISEKDLKEFLMELLNGGYKIISVEGSFMAIVDYEGFKRLSEHVTDELKAYIEIMAVQSNQPTAMDGGVIISWDELADRILRMEEYLKKYKHETRKGIMKEIYAGSIMSYLGGMDNTPVFDYDTDMLLNDMLTSFNNAANKNSDTYLAAIIREYITLLEQEGFMYTERVQDYLMNITETVEKLIK